MRTIINTLLILIAIAALVTAALRYMQRLAADGINQKALAAVLENNATLRMRITALNSAMPNSPQTRVPKNADDIANKNAAGESQPVRAKGPWGVSETFEYQEAKRKALEEYKLNDPEFGLKYYAMLRSKVDAQYGPFYELQHLTKERNAALAEALFQRQLRHQKADADKQAGGSDADAQLEKADANLELAASAQEALGADLYAHFSLYERQRPAWDYVGNLGGMLSLIDKPLSLEQASLLADAIANSNTSFRNGEAVKMTRSVTSQDWNGVYAAAADFLSPEQLDFFKNTYIAPGNADVVPQQEMEMNSAFEKSGFRGRLRYEPIY